MTVQPGVSGSFNVLISSAGRWMALLNANHTSLPRFGWVGEVHTTAKPVFMLHPNTTQAMYVL